MEKQEKDSGTTIRTRLAFLEASTEFWWSHLLYGIAGGVLSSMDFT